MYVNAKIIPFETVPAIKGGGMKDSGGDEFKYNNIQ
jgi:hypothetical protein